MENSEKFTSSFKSFVMYSLDEETPQQFMRRLLDEIDALGAVELHNVFVAQELSSPELSWSATVYWIPQNL